LKDFVRKQVLLGLMGRGPRLLGGWVPVYKRHKPRVLEDARRSETISTLLFIFILYLLFIFFPK
jgi:hypothetical protein